MKRAAYVGNVNEGINFLTVVTDLSVEDLLTHYTDQTKGDRNDWTLRDCEATSSVAWSSWTVMDECGETWDGSITISKPPSIDDPFVTIRVIRDP